MKKQFFRVKQLADQTFSRAGKTEALSDDLLEAEKRVEHIRSVCTYMEKTSIKEKRIKKSLDHNPLQEISTIKESILSQIITKYGESLVGLGQMTSDYETKTDANVISHLISVCENDGPNIDKQKRNLKKLILDMDSLRARYQTAVKHSGSTQSGSKIKDELEEAEMKVESARESLAYDILQLVARETELSKLILEYVQCQNNYHIAASHLLEKIIPEMEAIIRDSQRGPVFGRPLQEHLKVTRRRIAFPIELCVCGLLEVGTNEEGIFRVTPGASKVKRMKVSIDANFMNLETALQYRDPHIFAGVLKSYLRELPEPLLTYQLYDKWLSAARLLSSGNSKEGMQALSSVLKELPQENFENLNYLIKFLSSLAGNKDSNKMTPQNLAIVIAPNLIWSPNEDLSNMGTNMNIANLHNSIVEALVQCSDFFFPGEIDFFITMSRDFLTVNGDNNEGNSENQSEMKRAQSNSSLSDQNTSPPPGSPKPAIRRKTKPAAPNPPTLKNMGSKEEFMSSMDEDYGGPDRTSKNYTSEEERKPEHKKEEKSKEEKEKLYESWRLISAEKKPIDKSVAEKFIRAERFQETQTREDGKLDKRNSKSGEDLRKFGLSKSSCLQEPSYSTLDRKRPPRPTPAPRTSLELKEPIEEAKKPAVPERPASLQRPHSSSFRMVRSLDPDSEKEGGGEGRCLERTHMYSVDKQQVTFKSLKGNPKPGDGKENGEKPEKPKKPDSLVTVPGHQRAASEGSIIETGNLSPSDGGRNLSRVNRPTPPPPPPPTAAKRESTNL